MRISDLIKALNHLKVQTGSLACLGCGYEQNCSTHGCRLVREAVDRLCGMEWIDTTLAPPDHFCEVAKMPLSTPNEWVSIEERLPEKSDGMILLTNGKIVIPGYRNQMFRLDERCGVFAPSIKRGGGYIRVTHWMPLPEMPEEET